MARSLTFYWARLRNASWPEMLERLREKTFIETLRLRCVLPGCALRVPEVSPAFLAELQFPEAHVEPGSGDFFAAERVHGLDAATIKEEENRFRKVFFARIRADQIEHDLRALWEPARLQEITAILAGISSVPEAQQESLALQLALSWIAANPFPFGLHYMSVMECGLRIPVFVRCLTLSPRAEDSRQPLFTAIYQHAWLTAHRLSRYSSLGNHTVAEAVGLIFAGAIFAETAPGQAWLRTGQRLLNQELDHQVLDDGGPAEQSLSYHRFVLDLYWLALDFLEKNALRDCSDWKPRLMAGEAFLAALTDRDGFYPAIGDNDDGRALAPGLAPTRGIEGSALSTGNLQTFSSSGYTVLGRGSDVLLCFDHGPLGMPPLYNHGHADALSLTLSVKGKQMLVDSGTYRYNGVAVWRKCFKGTRAHNTVTIDGLDQAEQVTGFIWAKPYTAQLLSCEKTDLGIRLEASHNGYNRLPQAVEHRRSLLWSEQGFLLVRDAFTGTGEHTFELNFHLHPEASVTERDGCWQISREDASLTFYLLEGEHFTPVHGQYSPILGWFSPSYGLKQKTTVLQIRKKGTPEAITFTAALIFSEDWHPEKLSQYAQYL